MDIDGRYRVSSTHKCLSDSEINERCKAMHKVILYMRLRDIVLYISPLALLIIGSYTCLRYVKIHSYVVVDVVFNTGICLVILLTILGVFNVIINNNANNADLDLKSMMSKDALNLSDLYINPNGTISVFVNNSEYILNCRGIYVFETCVSSIFLMFNAILICDKVSVIEDGNNENYHEPLYISFISENKFLSKKLTEFEQSERYVITRSIL